MAQVVEVEKNSAQNFIPARERRTTNSRTLTRAGILATAITVAGSTAGLAYLTLAAPKNVVDEFRIEEATAALEAEQQFLETQLGEVNEVAAQLHEINIDAFNLPAIFASHLPELVPPELVLTQVAVDHRDDSWTFALSGITSIGLSASAPVLQRLEAALSAEPWNLTVTRSWTEGWMEQFRNGGAATNGVIAFEIESEVQ